MFIASKVNLRGGRGTVSNSDSLATGEDRISSTEGLRCRNWYGCQITLESVLSLKALWGGSQSCLPGKAFLILACYFAILRNWNVSKSGGKPPSSLCGSRSEKEHSVLEARDSAFAGRWVLEAASMATKSKGVPLSSHREILEISKTFWEQMYLLSVRQVY